LRSRIEDTNDIFSMIAELRDALRKGKKLDPKKMIPGQWRAHVYDASTIAQDGVLYDVMRRQVTPAHAVPFERLWETKDAIQPPSQPPPLSRDVSTSRLHDAIFEMQNFPPAPEPVVCRSFVNSLFVYPETINLSREKKKMNLCVTVYLRDSDVPLGDKEQCLPCFQGRGGGFVQSLTSSVIYHTKTATFLDEMKANLPFPLTPSHHLLFVVQNIPVDADEKPEADAQVWYTCLPLLQNGSCLESSTYALLVNSGMPPSKYLSLRDSSGTESQRLQIFRVRIHIASTVYPQDKAVQSFLSNALNPKLTSAAVLDALRSVTAIKRELGVQFFVPIVRTLCICACSDASTEVSMLSVKALFAFLYNISQVLPGQGPRYPLLAEYITYDHDNLQGTASIATSKEVFEGLASSFAHFLNMLQKTDADDGPFSYDVIFSFTWFVLEMISKSLTLAVSDAGHLSDPRRHTWLSKEDKWEEFARNLKKIAQNLGKHIGQSVKRGDCKTAPDANVSWALFLRDLLPVFHRGRVIEAARAYLD
jgi:hypothetical protein